MGRKKKKRIKLKCPICGKIKYILPRIAKRDWSCSVKCKNKLHSMRMKKKKIKWRCPVCNKIKYLLPYDIKNRKSCSNKCRGIIVQKRMIGSKLNVGRIPWNKGITGYTTKRKGMKHSEKTKTKMKKRHFFKTNPEKHRKNYFRSGINKPSKYENIFAKILDKYKVNFEQQAVINNKYQVDFFVKDKKMIIEIDGSWHYKCGELRYYDKKRDEEIKELGYDVIHIKNEEVELYGSKEKLVELALV